MGFFMYSFLLRWSLILGYDMVLFDVFAKTFSMGPALPVRNAGWPL